MPIDSLSLIDNAVQTISIFDHPGSILPTDSGMETRDALLWYLYVIATQATNRHNGLIELTHTDDLSIDLDANSSTLRYLIGSIAISAVGTCSNSCNRCVLSCCNYGCILLHYSSRP